MSSKVKSKTYIVLHRGQIINAGYGVLGRYRVGAKNVKEAETLVKTLVGKHAKVKVYYEELVKLLDNGIIIKEC